GRARAGSPGDALRVRRDDGRAAGARPRAPYGRSRGARRERLSARPALPAASRTPARGDMPELRKDPTVGRWVIIATERVRRPRDSPPPRAARRGGPCALCAGHEHETPPEVLAYRDGAGARPDTPGWRVRVVPNKFPALRIEGDLERR